MLSFSSKKRLPLAAALGCSCRRTTLGSLFSFPPAKAKPEAATNFGGKRHQHRRRRGGRPLWNEPPQSPSTAATSPRETTISPPFTEATSSPRCALWATAAEKRPPRGAAKGRLAESVPVVKVSHQPLQDFRESMLQMILEEEIFAWEDLRELLRCFLVLNSPHHHDAILIAFSDICTGVFSAAATATA
ncbi:unnamed protein product [Spirodela intermedia]|uniref:Transcription repressor n=1 Tax=Spirodela intermedia TaxID=51605 RepID=A0A7I8L5N9_SPIIN|nr:unnamed protein product [Spirodela intermedia]